MKNDDSSDIAITTKDLGIRYRIPTERINGTKDFVIKKLKNRLIMEDLWALRHITISVARGSSLGVMGKNGSGKSTLLKAIARVLTPIEGRIIVRGHVFPLLELGAGFISELTGLENVYLYGNLLGLSNEEISKLYPDIMAFSEIGDFIHSPLRSYSSGMVARLAFSIATAVQPDILLADEILSVGDASFQSKCMERMNYYLSHGTTIIFVSHSSEQVKKVCQYGLWLDHGIQKMYGDAEEIANAYAKSY